MLTSCSKCVLGAPSLYDLQRVPCSTPLMQQHLAVFTCRDAFQMASACRSPAIWPPLYLLQGVSAQSRQGRRGFAAKQSAKKHARATAMGAESTGPSTRIFISTGDASGNLHGAMLIGALRDKAQRLGLSVDVCALGGSRMEAAGATLVANNEELSSIGFAEAISLILPTLRKQAKVRAYLKDHPPDLVVLIDYPGVNIPIGRYLKKTFGVPTVYYIPPNEWLWNESRTPTICSMCDLVLAVYPAEAEYFRSKGAQVELVGHPLVDTTLGKPPRTEARALLGVGDNIFLTALMPASREQELRHVWPVIAQAARLLQDKLAAQGRAAPTFVVPVAAASHREALKAGAERAGIQVRLWNGDPHVPMAAADLALTKSGSVNLQLALLNVPQVVVYRLDALSVWLARTLFRFNVRFVSLVNLITEEQVVPEFIQEDATPEALAASAFEITRDPYRSKQMLEGYERLRARLGGSGAPQRAAELIIDLARGVGS